MDKQTLKRGVLWEGCFPDGRYDVPSCITRIDPRCFRAYADMQAVELPDSLVDIDSEAFSCCPNLTCISLPAFLEEIGEHAFSSNRFTEVTIPGSVMRISPCCFSASNTLHNVTIEEGTEYIEARAFADCLNLNEIRIPASVHTIAENAFERCPRLCIIAPSSSLAADFARRHGIPTTER